MSNQNVNMSDWEWDGVVNTPERQEAAAQRHMKEQKDRAEKEGFLCNFYEKTEQRRKVRVEVEACRYTLGAMIAGLVAYFCGVGGVAWLAWVLGASAVALALIAAYGFGKVKEMGRK